MQNRFLISKFPAKFINARNDMHVEQNQIYSDNYPAEC
jgi:hypothetical protein